MDFEQTVKCKFPQSASKILYTILTLVVLCGFWISEMVLSDRNTRFCRLLAAEFMASILLTDLSGAGPTLPTFSLVGCTGGSWVCVSGTLIEPSSVVM